MPERIDKLQPNRTLHLRGFDGLGAAAALHSATASSFKVSGVFRDPADFAVLILHDADNFYEHPRLKYLPDTNFSGLTLTFDVHYSGLMPLDSPKFPTIDWPYLDAIRPDGTKAQIPLFAHATPAGGSYLAAGASFVVEDNGLEPYDRLTLWYQNFAFDYIVPNDPGNLPSASEVAAALAAQINGVNWNGLGVLVPLQAEAAGNELRIWAARPGEDGNMIRMYAVAKNNRLRTTAPVVAFSGGSSDATWRVTLDFSALGIPQVRQMWLTFAPALANGVVFADTEWEASFTNWVLTGPEAARALSVAGPDSVRVEEDESWCTYSGQWAAETGFYSGGFARRASSEGDLVMVFYSCQREHDLYVGTSLYTDRAAVGVSLDGDAETDLNCFLETEPPVVTRRRICQAVAAGQHTVTLRVKSAGYFYFDFLEAAAPSDVPDPPPPAADLSPALDYSTDHTYKLSPARLLWSFDQLGYAGPMNEYLGVFWWNQRKRVGAVIPSVTVTFEGEFLDGDQVFVSVGGQVCGKTVFANEDTSVIARHFAYFINETYVGVWASAEANVLTVVSRSPAAAYSFAFNAWKESAQNSSGMVAFTGSLEGGQAGEWVIDPAQSEVLNRGARAWHGDFYRECRLRNREIVTACSMELVNPPAGFAAKFADGQEVKTAVGFGNLVSSHCAFATPMADYQKRVYAELAGLMAAESLTPNLQFGEFCWWYFTNLGSMAYYDDETKAAALAALGRPLHGFGGPDDDPAVNDGADATFLRDRLRDYMAALIAHVRATHAGAQFEVLFPYDVNYPTPAGVHQIGGRLNRYVNLPAEWERKETSGFDRLKTEALDFGAWSRDLNLTRAAVVLPRELGWPLDAVRHMVPVFRPGYPWEKEFLTALGEGVSTVNLWAFDHVCLYGLPLRAELGHGSAKRQG